MRDNCLDLFGVLNLFFSGGENLLVILFLMQIFLKIYWKQQNIEMVHWYGKHKSTKKTKTSVEW